MSGPCLLLASSSPTRKKLLEEAGISFKTVKHVFDEEVIEKRGDLTTIVKLLAQSKARSVSLDAVNDRDLIVLAADTLVVDSSGFAWGKPRDYDHAVETLKRIRDGGARVVTGICGRRLVYRGAQWEVMEEICSVISAEVVLDLPDEWIPVYLQGHRDFLHTAGALAVEGFGAQFVKCTTGSYTAILGLPMSEVRCMLSHWGFFDGLKTR